MSRITERDRIRCDWCGKEGDCQTNNIPQGWVTALTYESYNGVGIMELCSPKCLRSWAAGLEDFAKDGREIRTCTPPGADGAGKGLSSNQGWAAISEELHTIAEELRFIRGTMQIKERDERVD